LGVQVAIDDFGTGYSSLAYLKRFPIDKLKVDKSFIADIPANLADMEITAAIIGLAKNLNLEVLAEGVETQAQLAFLRGKGCDTVQGFLFSRPLSAEGLIKVLVEGKNVGWTGPIGPGRHSRAGAA
jgi:EAL domain-containing protein (putative c-di-GMP-specific phosphodiesterase class I)